ncbi:MAG: hypothetical protein JXB26_15490 [Candidatus Aminicenantes bacterium]|nr:hypothetical protein [Candidatus Aminicenantes bacterium]
MTKQQGLNSQIIHNGNTYHIQTQDKGPGMPYVESIIYKSGQLLTIQKTDYTSSLNDPQLEKKIAQIIRDQHYSIMREISKGKF